jgi:hypothetical protein
MLHITETMKVMSFMHSSSSNNDHGSPIFDQGPESKPRLSLMATLLYPKHGASRVYGNPTLHGSLLQLDFELLQAKLIGFTSPHNPASDKPKSQKN